MFLVRRYDAGMLAPQVEAPFADPALKRSLQASLLELLIGDDEVVERAALAEEILGGESGEPAAKLALELMSLRKRLGDERRVIAAVVVEHRHDRRDDVGRRRNLAED